MLNILIKSRDNINIVLEKEKRVERNVTTFGHTFLILNFQFVHIGFLAQIPMAS